jgi:hypothetical protein
MENNMSTALTAPTPTALAVGFEGYKVTPAQMKLVQRTSTDPEATPGKLFDTVAKSNLDSVQAVMLAFRSSRVLFPPGGELGQEPLCRSNNGVVPAADANVPQCTSCALCDHGPKVWKTWKKTGIKPDCQEKQNILFVMRDSGLPYWLSIGGMSIKNFGLLKDAIFRDILSLKTKEKRSIYDYTFEIKPLFVQGKRGSYYVLTFANIKRIDAIDEFKPAFEQFVVTQNEVEKELETEGIIEAEYVDEPTVRVEV